MKKIQLHKDDKHPCRAKLIVLFMVLVFALPSFSQITVNIQNKPLRQTLKEIEKVSDYRFFYNESLPILNNSSSLNVENANIDDVMQQLLANKNVRYEKNNNIIALVEVENNAAQTLASQQKVTIKGRVVDAEGVPIIGANIVEMGPVSNGTITDNDGNFTLNVLRNATIKISYIGYKDIVINTADRTSFNIVMEEDTQTLSELVVTALGIKREEKALGYSVQTVEGAGLQTVKGVDIGTSLTGKVAGLLVKNSTEFTADPSIQIRGENPLLVIDGVPYANMTLRDIPSDDIENISVLKGATASALYGYRGASGAIMITTQKGLAKKGLSISVNSGTMVAAGHLAIPEMQSSFGRVVKKNADGNLEYVRSGDGSWGLPLDGREVIQWNPISKTMEPMPYLPIGKDNFNNFLEQGYILNNNINLVQQGEFGSFRTSATWVNNKGQYPNSIYDKITFSLGGDMKIDKFELSASMAYNKQKSPNVGFNGYRGYDPMYNLLVWSAPDYDVRDYKDYWLIENEVQNSSYTAGNNNPYFDRKERTHSIDRDIFNGSVSADYNFTSWLKGTVRTGFDIYSDRQDITISKGSFQGAGTAQVLKGGSEVWGESQRGSFNIGLGRGYSINNDLLLSADKTFNDFRVDGFIGGTIYYTQDDGIEALTKGGLSIPAFYSLKASINPVAVKSVIYKQQVNSLYGRLGASWKSLLYAEFTLRNDWSSTLSEDTRSYLYPSISGSFIASELLPKYDWLSLWKIRGSWTSSKTPANIYDINSVYSITTNAWGDLTSASYPTTIRGTDVLPESASTFEVGTAINVLKNRASVDVSYYEKKMFDFLRSAGISPASGYTSNFVNTDEEIVRKGVEITLSGTPVKTKDWQWDVSFNWSKYARYYSKLDSVYSADKPWVEVGERVDHYVLNDYLKDPEGNIIHNNGLPTYSKYQSLYGYADPDWLWGLSTSLRYKNFDLNISMDGRVGGLAETTTEMYMWRAGSHPNSVVPERFLDANNPGSKNYIGEGVKVVSGEVSFDTYGNIVSDTRTYAPNDVPTTYQTYVNSLHKGTAWGGSPSTLDTYSTTFFKIREISLTYNLPTQITEKFNANAASISAVGQNLFLWAKQFKYSDPDGGFENFSDPSIRYLGLNLKVVF
ncbi:MAG: SusC/RagA family TonB-linked outer membrane protein [Dysgonamonadaceae bacterium]|nr:SusC/RagA family TonB-linked outer membrane protein [Dysgonamonadaceae bacterium]MDD4246020.1 SusC/RagA family TonB-linked outer membrane protein [Dysgonamonadaceae bacterium]